MSDRFTRQETLFLTRCSSSRLSYLEKVGLIVPSRNGCEVYFSFMQLLQTLATKKLSLHLSSTRDIFEFMNRERFDGMAWDKRMAIVNGAVRIICSDFSDLPPLLIEATKEDNPQGRVSHVDLRVIPCLQDLYWDLFINSTRQILTMELTNRLTLIPSAHFGITLPQVREMQGGRVALTWTESYPQKELEIWLGFNDETIEAEWMISVNDKDHEGVAKSVPELVSVIYRYFEVPAAFCFSWGNSQDRSKFSDKANSTIIPETALIS